MAEQIIHWDAVPGLGLPAVDATPSTVKWLWEIVLAVEGFRAICVMARQASRDMSQLMQPDCADLSNIAPRVGLYLCLIKCFKRAVETSGEAYEALEQEKNLPVVVLSSFASYCQHDAGKVIKALVTLGSQLNGALYHHVRLKLADATDADADAFGPQPRAATDQARDEALLLINFSKALERRLRSYRGREHCDLDTAALFESYATAFEAVEELGRRVQEDKNSGGLSAAVQRLGGDRSAFTNRGLIADLIALPISWSLALIKRARHLLREAYESEAPQQEKGNTTALDAPVSDKEDSPSFGDLTPDPKAVDPQEQLIQKEADGERHRAAAALRAQVGQLPAKQSEVLLEYWKGLRDGYRLSSKGGESFRQFWGDGEYTRKQVTLWRVREAHSALVAAVERAAVYLPSSEL